MKTRILWNDLKANRLLSFSSWAFMAVSACLSALTCFLFAGLLSSIDVLMDKAGTPDFLQMHAGELHKEELEQFAREHSAVQAYQILEFLNLENGSMMLGAHSLADSTQDNGVCIQSGEFDYLLGLENQVLEAKKGEIYVPVCYRQEYSSLSLGDTVQIGEESFTIAGFLRDSQMNSMLSSSKRFLVSEEDYQRLREMGSEEYLIEFLLKDGADGNAFAEDYQNAGLPANGPAITRPLIKLMNALSDGMMGALLLLISVVMLLISMLCIRFTLLDKLTTDRREIGMLKAVGIGKRQIRQIYFLKYILLSAVGAVTGLLAAYLFKTPLQRGMQELYGASEAGMEMFLVSACGVALIEGILLLFIWRTLKKTERMSAIEALTGRDDEHTGRQSCVLVAVVLAALVFLMVVPQNLYSTISSKGFVTYMGIGGGQIRMDIRQTKDISAKTKQLKELLGKDKQVEKSVSLLTKSYRIRLLDGTETSLNVEQGDHTVFPVAYASGRAPLKEGEIALSYLCGEELRLESGDTLTLMVEGRECAYTVCGIYSDITNGGKTAKTALIKDTAPVMWSVFYASLKDGVSAKQWMMEWENHLAAAQINAKVVDIQDYVSATYGQTIERIYLASLAARLAAVAVTVIVVFLFTRLMLARDRNDISLRKALGFTGKEIKEIYGRRYLLTSCAGIILGILAGNMLGELLTGGVLYSLGAAGFQFITNAGEVYLIIPVLMLVSVGVSVWAALREISGIQAYECCLGRE